MALRNRPHSRDALNYGQVLIKSFQNIGITTFLNNMSFSRATVLDFLYKKNEIINKFPDYYIINLGVCDAATREVPLWFSNYINSNGNSYFKSFCKGINVKIFTPNRSFLTKLRGKKAFVSKRSFRYGISKLFSLIVKNTNAKIIVLSINKANDRIEKELPGSRENYIFYNKILKEECAEVGGWFVDLNDLDTKTHYPDGTHFSPIGNNIVASRILKLIVLDTNLNYSL